ncbi:MAG: signal peptide peptidase SppA [Chitinispirillaceae bacterium]|nr:signal peptide peptidase SppA [Chitinispirillaceae bacterium]
MKTVQKFLIASILVLPVLIGIAMLFQSTGQTGRSSFSGSFPFKRIGLVEIKGTIYESDEYVRQLRTFRLDNSIAGVILRIDSPGGAVAPAQEIYGEIKKYREIHKPVVVSMGTVAASGGYYIAAPATRIFADPGTLTGSIGVIFTLPLYQELSKKIGVEFRILKAGALKDAGSPYRDMQKSEKELLEGLLEDTHEQFIDDVARGRAMSRDTLEQYADGRVLSGRQACQAGLVDTLGGFEDAAEWIRNFTGLSSGAKIVRKKTTPSRILDWFEDESSKLFPFLHQIKRPAGLYYLMSIKGN